MVVKYQHSAGRLLIEKDSVPIFDTDAFPVQFYPIAQEITVSKTITFPDFVKANSYGFARGAQGSNFVNSCQSYVTLPYQEWGPAAIAPPTDYNLSDEVIGTVPGETDVLLVRVNLNRTTNPSAINGNAIPVTFDAGQWVQVDGGALIVEMLPPMTRMLSIVLSETLNPNGTRNVLLRRVQSVSKKLYTYWRGDGNPQVSGWTYGGTRGRYGHIVSLIQAKGPTFGPDGWSGLARGNSGQCSLVDNTNYSSVYSGQISITPGKTNLDKQGTGGGKSLVLCDNVLDETFTNSRTFSNVFVGTPKPDRQIIVLVCGQRDHVGVTGEGVLTGITIDGIAATIRTQRGLHGVAAIATLQSASIGDTADIAVSFDYGTRGIMLFVLAGYGLNFNSAVSVVQSSADPYDARINLATPADGYAVCVGTGYRENTLTGIGNSYAELIAISQPLARSFMVGRGFQRTSGQTLNIVWRDIQDVGSGSLAAATFT